MIYLHVFWDFTYLPLIDPSASVDGMDKPLDIRSEVKSVPFGIRLSDRRLPVPASVLAIYDLAFESFAPRSWRSSDAQPLNFAKFIALV
jgi:hypothetical protein